MAGPAGTVSEAEDLLGPSTHRMLLTSIFEGANNPSAALRD